MKGTKKNKNRLDLDHCFKPDRYSSKNTERAYSKIAIERVVATNSNTQQPGIIEIKRERSKQ